MAWNPLSSWHNAREASGIARTRSLTPLRELVAADNARRGEGARLLVVLRARADFEGLVDADLRFLDMILSLLYVIARQANATSS
jgi:hypothetical protein